MATKKKKPGSAVKPTVKKRTLNTSQSGKPAKGAPASEQDVQRRLGNFDGAGEAPRKGGRFGIVGQTTKTSRTDNKKNTGKKN